MYSHTKNGERILWCLLESDAQDMAEARIKRKLSVVELLQVKKGLESGLGECWHDIMATSMDLAVAHSEVIEYERKTRIVKSLLRGGIRVHNQGKCTCTFSLAENNQRLCYAGRWLKGIISNEEVLEDFSLEGEQKMSNDFQKAEKKIKQLVDRAKRERDRKGYRENLGYDSRGKLEEFLHTLNLSYSDEARLFELFYAECEKI